MKEDDLTYRGEIHLDLTQTDAMFQDANRNFFQNVRINRHFDALFDSMSSSLTRDQQKHLYYVNLNISDWTNLNPFIISILLN